MYLPDELLALLSRHVAEHRPGGAPTRWMFEGSPGQPPHQNTVGHRWRQTCARAGVSGVTLHDLRHLYAIGLIAAGCDVVTIQRALGHARATTTLNTYAHLWPTAEDRTRRAAGALGRRPRAACHSRGQRGGSVGRFSKALCVRARHGATLCSASRGGGTMPVTRVDQGWLSAARPAQAGGVPRGRTGVMTRAATAVREGRFWVVHVPGVGVTQGRSVREARALAADLVEAMTGTAEDVDVHFEPGGRRPVDRRPRAPRRQGVAAGAGRRQRGPAGPSLGYRRRLAQVRRGPQPARRRGPSRPLPCTSCGPCADWRGSVGR